MSPAGKFERACGHRIRGQEARPILLALLLLPLLACQPGEAPTGDDKATQRTALIGAVSGEVPTGLPPRLMVGLFEDTQFTWMRDSGVRWDVRYRYFTKGWTTNWGWGPTQGYWGLEYMQQCDAQGFIPAIQFYQMNDEPGGGEESFLKKVQSTSTMKSYFSDVKLLMQRAKDFGKPVLLLIEADGYGLLQLQTQNNPNAYAAVAATGLPELAGLPNTVAGWGLAFLQLRKAVGATNAILGIHVSGWASGKDIAHTSVTDALQPEVTKVHEFLKPLGLGTNVTGTTYDVLVGDPLDRDADYYRLYRGEDRWWDPSDSAPLDTRSFNRYAEWLRLWNATSGKRWVLWQIPLGNSNHLNVVSSANDLPREGFKDNRTEYFFGPNGLAHLEKFASSGVMALLFGRGMPSQATYTNDYYLDGQLFMKSRAGNFLQGGGLAIPASPTSGPTSPPNALAPSYTSTATVSATSVPAGSTVDISATLTATGGPQSGALVDIEVYDSAGTKVGQKGFDNQSFFYGQSGTYLYSWSVPATGTYTVKVGVFDSAWTTHHWNASAATLQGETAEPSSDTAFYNFESGTQGWAFSGTLTGGVSTATAPVWAGAQSLAVAVAGTDAVSGQAYVLSPSASTGSTVTFRVWIPAGHRLSAIQPYVQEGTGGGWRWTSGWYPGSALVPEAWNTLTVQVPADAVMPLHQLGLQFFTEAAWSGTCFVDSVSW